MFFVIMVCWLKKKILFLIQLSILFSNVYLVLQLDLNFDSVKSINASYCRPETNQLQRSTVKEFSANLSTQITYDDSTQPSSSEASELGHGFRLPDLNMVPSEVDYASEMLWGKKHMFVLLYPTSDNPHWLVEQRSYATCTFRQIMGTVINQ